MRALCLLVLSACSSPWSGGSNESYDGAFDTASYQPDEGFTARGFTAVGSVYGETVGVALAGEQGLWVGMSDNTCLFTNDGALSTDVDVVAGSADRVVDVQDVVVVVDSAGDEVATLDPAGEPLSRRFVPGLRDARSDGRGEVVVLVDDPEHGCAVAFHEAGVRTLVRVPLAPCAEADGFAVDRVGRRAWVGTTDGVYEVVPEGAKVLPLVGDLLSWDTKREQLYIAVRGQPTVSAVRFGGEEGWTSAPGGAVRHLKALGGAVAVATRAQGQHAVVVLDGERGEVVGEVESDEAVEGVVGGEGEVWALRMAGRVVWFR